MKKTHRTATSARATALIDSPVGKLFLAATDEGLTHILFVADMESRPIASPGSGKAARILARVRRQLAEYFGGRRHRFDLPLAPSGTPFQMATWKALREIPFGQTRSYGDLARRIGRARAVRAVGAANGANPIPIVVPCHRVIGADGSLTGYGGGLEIKKRLLRLEGARVP